MSILQKYQLEIKKINGSIHLISEIEKFQILSQYLDLWNNTREIKETLLPEINLVLNGMLEYNDIGGDVVGVAFVEKEKTELNGSEVGYSKMTLPTQDFKDLITEWLNILENPKDQG